MVRETEIETEVSKQMQEFNDTVKAQISIEIKSNFRDTNDLIEKLFTQVSFKQLQSENKLIKKIDQLSEEIENIRQSNISNSHFAKHGWKYAIVAFFLASLLALLIPYML